MIKSPVIEFFGALFNKNFIALHYISQVTYKEEEIGKKAIESLNPFQKLLFYTGLAYMPLFGSNNIVLFRIFKKYEKEKGIRFDTIIKIAKNIASENGNKRQETVDYIKNVAKVSLAFSFLFIPVVIDISWKLAVAFPVIIVFIITFLIHSINNTNSDVLSIENTNKATENIADMIKKEANIIETYSAEELVDCIAGIRKITETYSAMELSDISALRTSLITFIKKGIKKVRTSSYTTEEITNLQKELMRFILSEQIEGIGIKDDLLEEVISFDSSIVDLECLKGILVEEKFQLSLVTNTTNPINREKGLELRRILEKGIIPTDTVLKEAFKTESLKLLPELILFEWVDKSDITSNDKLLLKKRLLKFKYPNSGEQIEELKNNELEVLVDILENLAAVNVYIIYTLIQNIDIIEKIGEQAKSGKAKQIAHYLLLEYIIKKTKPSSQFVKKLLDSLKNDTILEENFVLDEKYTLFCNYIRTFKQFIKEPYNGDDIIGYFIKNRHRYSVYEVLAVFQNTFVEDEKERGKFVKRRPVDFTMALYVIERIREKVTTKITKEAFLYFYRQAIIEKIVSNNFNNKAMLIKDGDHSWVYIEKPQYLYWLSSDTWCTSRYHNNVSGAATEEDFTRTFMVDFHQYFWIYIDERNCPLVAVRVKDNKILEIEGVQNNQVLPVDYLYQIYECFGKLDYSIDTHLMSRLKEEKEQLDTISFWIKNLRGKLIITKDDLLWEVNIAISNFKEKDNNQKIGMLKKFGFKSDNIEFLKDKNSEFLLNLFILQLFGFEPTFKKEGDKTGISISHYSPWYRILDLKKLGIEEQNLFSNVVEIRGNCDIINNNTIKFNSLTRIGGNLFVYNPEFVEKRSGVITFNEKFVSLLDTKFPKLEIIEFKDDENGSVVYDVKMTIKAKIGGIPIIGIPKDMIYYCQ